MSILIANNVPRKEYTVGQGVEQKVFAVTFEFFNDAEVNININIFCRYEKSSIINKKDLVNVVGRF